MTKYINYTKDWALQHQRKYNKRIHDEFFKNWQMEQHINESSTKFELYFSLLDTLRYFLKEMYEEDEDYKELDLMMQSFTESFELGKPNSVPLSCFESWLLLDRRFGEDQMTVCERMLRGVLLSVIEENNEDFITNLFMLSNSYFTFYKIIQINRHDAIIEDIYTHTRWKTLQAIPDPININGIPKEGDILFTRLYGTTEEAYTGSIPTGFNKKPEKDLIELINNNIKTAVKMFKVKKKDAYVFSSKEYLFETLKSLYPS